MAETPKYAFEMAMKVRDYEVDSQGIVNNANYLHYFEHTRHEFCEAAGTTFRSLQEAGLDPVVSHIEVAYHTPLRLGDTFVSKLWLNREGARFIFYQDIFTASGQLSARAKVTIATLRDGRLTRGDEIAEAFGAYLADNK